MDLVPALSVALATMSAVAAILYQVRLLLRDRRQDRLDRSTIASCPPDKRLDGYVRIIEARRGRGPCAIRSARSRSRPAIEG